MPGQMYSAVFEGVAVSAAQDLFEILAGTVRSFKIHSIHISQSSDAGDSESEQLSISIQRVTGAPTSGSGGSTPTPQPYDEGYAASGVVVEANNTTVLTGGTIVSLFRQSFNVMAGIDIIFTPETMPHFRISTRALIELHTAPADALTMDGTVIFEEIG